MATESASSGTPSEPVRALQGSRPYEVYYVYADADEGYLLRLDQHFNVLEQQRLLRGWHRRKLLPGEEQDVAIQQHIGRADIILLLVSPDLLDDRSPCSREMERTVLRHGSGEVVVVPVLVRPSLWAHHPFLSKLQPLPSDGVPISVRGTPDTALVQVAEWVYRLLVKPGAHPPSGRGSGGVAGANPWMRRAGVALLAAAVGALVYWALPVDLLSKDVRRPSDGIPQREPSAMLLMEPERDDETVEELSFERAEPPRRPEGAPKPPVLAPPAVPDALGGASPLAEQAREEEPQPPRAGSSAQAEERLLNFGYYPSELANADIRARRRCNDLVDAETMVAVELRFHPTGEVSVTRVAGPIGTAAKHCVLRAFEALRVKPFKGNVFGTTQTVVLRGKSGWR